MTEHVDVLIIGSGIMGSATASELRRLHPQSTIIMVDGGSAIGDVPGLHLHDSADPVIWDRYNQRVASGIQGLYAGPTVGGVMPAATLGALEPGLRRLAEFGAIADAAPAASNAWNVGGMGIHWTAATPWPWGHERFDDDEAAWNADLETARRLLRVNPAALGPTGPGAIVVNALARRFAGVAAERAPQPMPMAVNRADDGSLHRTGPSVIFPPIASGGDEDFRLLPGTLAVELLHEQRRVAGARVRDVISGEEREITASITIVCADAHRTPQLLYASNIRPEALGRYLNEHAFLAGRVLMDLDRFGLTLDDLPRLENGEFATDSLWLPQAGPDQPFHGQIMNTTFVDSDDRALAYSVGVNIYVPIETRRENRIVFDPDTLDVTGMPRMTIEFSYSEADLAMIERAKAVQAAISSDFGEFDPETESILLPAGASLHQTGTVRSGRNDDGTSVCDPDGLVWGFDNLFVAGVGVVPTALICNATLTGMITTVRSARAAARLLDADTTGKP